MQKLWERIVAFWKRYEHRIGVGALLFGFIFDLFLAKRPDSVVDNVLLVSYLFIAGSIIIFLNIRKARQQEKENPTEPLILLLILQFCFGGLASNLLVLYGKSGTYTGSAIFIALLLGLVFGNEFMRSRYSQLRFNIGVYYLLLFTYLIIAVPTFVLHSIGAQVFIATGLLSLAIMGGFLALVYFAVLRGKEKKKHIIEVSTLVGVIFVVINSFYFLKIIPPVPLSLKDIGVYHTLVKNGGGGYVATYEAEPWYVFWRDTSGQYTYTPGELAYCFSAVFAPASLDAPVFHRWEYYDSTQHRWVTQSRVSFLISGGRAEGFRGYSIETDLTPGPWRCDVETGNGALIGRITFTALKALKKPSLSTTTL